MRLYLLLVYFLPFLSLAQPVNQPDAAEIRLRLEKLNFLGSVLYMAAHPDDENTNVIAWLANERLATTAYLSLTRGDGGQNLIGPEIREWLGVIRTQELLAARRIDGGQQFFTRAIDFGYSKSAKEAFNIWGRNAVMHDAIRVIRQFKPDVIITRFPPDERAGHGHHTASAIVAGDAFEQASRDDIFPSQARELGTWQVTRLYTNTGRWWNTTIDKHTPGIIRLDVGEYNPLLGKSYSEISALASSQHKSQGWGRPGLRGQRLEFLEHEKGPRAKADIFEGVDTTWNRVPGGGEIQALVDEAIHAFQPSQPWSTVPQLIKIRKSIRALPENVWKWRKLQETDQLIVACLGLFVEATANHYQCAPGEHAGISVELVNRSPVKVSVQSVSAPGLAWDTTFSAALDYNAPLSVSFRGQLDGQSGYSSPYWLRKPHDQGLYEVDEEEMIGRAENPPALTATVVVSVGGEILSLERPVIYKWVDPVKGELWRPFEIVPPVIVNLSEDVLVFGNDEPRRVEVLVRSASERPQSGELKVGLPTGWRSEPASVPFTLPSRGAESTVVIEVFPSRQESTGSLSVEAVVDGKRYDQSLRLIDYDHFPIQTLLFPATAKTVRIDLRTAGNIVGYVPGAGDEIPAALRNMGYEVWVLADHEITRANLQKLDAVVLGIRCLNTNPRARYFMPALLEYVHDGGTLVVQYNTSQRMNSDKIAPYEIRIGRDRVTDETAEVRMLAPNHPVLTSPNKITSADFDNWVQERGLYFPSQWADEFQAILSMNDPGEAPKNGSLLVASYGRGYYVYTGISFFRQLPEGIGGAYKLFANLVSLGAGQQKGADIRNPRTRDKRK